MIVSDALHGVWISIISIPVIGSKIIDKNRGDKFFSNREAFSGLYPESSSKHNKF